MICGVNPNSFIDYPKEIAYVIFLAGCNFKCPFCHNKSVVNAKSNYLIEEEILKDLIDRKNFTDAVVITGGEPTIYDEKLVELIKKLKNLNLKIKLDTNGTNPALLKKIIKQNLINFVAMDIKNIFSKYDKTAGAKVNIDNIKKSIEIIENSNIDYQFRTTINKTNHNIEDLKEILSYINDKNKFIVQRYKFNDQQIINKNFGEFDEEEIEEINNKIKEDF